MQEDHKNKITALEDENDLLRKRLEAAEYQLDAQRNEIRRLHSVIREMRDSSEDMPFH